KTTKKELTKTSSSNDSFKSGLQTLTESESTLKAEVAVLTKRVQHSEELIAKSARSVVELAGKLAESREALLAVTHQRELAQTKLSKAETAHQVTKGEVKELTQRLREVETAFDVQKKELATRNRDLEEAQKELSSGSSKRAR